MVIKKDCKKKIANCQQYLLKPPVYNTGLALYENTPIVESIISSPIRRRGDILVKWGSFEFNKNKTQNPLTFPTYTWTFQCFVGFMTDD
jgi:hypothetical protein